MEQTLPNFPSADISRNRFSEIKLFYPPFILLDTVTYYDADNELQTLYDKDDAGTTDSLIIKPGGFPDLTTICPAVGTSWPSTAERPDAVAITFTCGWEDPDNIPPTIKQAIYLKTASHYERREDYVKKMMTCSENLLLLDRIDKF